MSARHGADVAALFRDIFPREPPGLIRGIEDRARERTRSPIGGSDRRLRSTARRRWFQAPVNAAGGSIKTRGARAAARRHHHHHHHHHHPSSRGTAGRARRRRRSSVVARRARACPPRSSRPWASRPPRARSQCARRPRRPRRRRRRRRRSTRRRLAAGSGCTSFATAGRR